jgi:DNA methylase
LLEDALLDISNRGNIVIDPFLGSGSCLIAADKTGRVCRGVELDPLYVDVIVRRYESATGNPTVFVETRRLRRWQHGGRRSRRRIKSGFDVKRTLRIGGATSHLGAEGPLAQRRGLGLRAYKLRQGWVSALYGRARTSCPHGPSSRFVPDFNGAFLSSDSKDALWDRFFMGTPRDCGGRSSDRT